MENSTLTTGSLSSIAILNKRIAFLEELIEIKESHLADKERVIQVKERIIQLFNMVDYNTNTLNKKCLNKSSCSNGISNTSVKANAFLRIVR